MNTTRDLAIETHHLSRRFGEKLAVADLSIAVKRGEVFGFLGPNGAGKTTSLKMLLGLIEPTSGKGTLLGKPIGDRAARAKVGFLPEHFRFQDWLTGRELLRFHGRLYGLSGSALDAKADALLTRMALQEAADRPIKGYSKGMTQRVGLAQAILNDPDIIFLDEPTSGLDPLGRLLVRDVIHELRAGGTSVFLNSHLLGEVEATCDRVVFVKQGRVVHELDMAATPSGLEVELRVHGTSDAALAAHGTVLSHADGVATVRVASEEQLPLLAAALVQSGARLYAMKPHKRSLEDTFLAVMGEDQRPG
ncbi:MAG: ABC transporter ATP-binding protein [Candidatus Eisenbacteria bacterium]